jgi:hypothetical protein
VLAAAALAAGAAAGSGTRVIRGDASLGGLRVGRAVPADARRLFGAPSSATAKPPDTCVLRWRRLGLVVDFLELSGSPPCRTGVVIFATATSRAAWRTSAGLRVGDPLARLRLLYPHAAHRSAPAGWWLITRHACPVAGNEPYPSLLARVRGGRVAAVVVSTRSCE